MNLINQNLAEVSERITHDKISKTLQNHERQSGIFAVWLAAYCVVLLGLTIWFIAHLFGAA